MRRLAAAGLLLALASQAGAADPQGPFQKMFCLRYGGGRVP